MAGGGGDALSGRIGTKPAHLSRLRRPGPGARPRDASRTDEQAAIPLTASDFDRAVESSAQCCDTRHGRAGRDRGPGPRTGPERPRPPREASLNRALDAAGAGLGLVLAAPALAAAAIAIKLEDGGPVFYRQERVGQHGRAFELVKLRTMVVGAEAQGAGWAVDRGDPRITTVGRLLRRLSLDELPQLWNVLRGDMSLIGPRPTLAYQVERYTPRQRRRLDVKPGLTGWAQVHGRSSLPWEERIELDVWYVENRSAWVDARILLRTPLALFAGTYKGSTGGWRQPDGEN
jgi:lipopolysaccharide/colanic/teichoic acid biosynthesis glycosyltransferase